VKLWLDDLSHDPDAGLRHPPPGYTAAVSVNAAIRLVEETLRAGGRFEHCSLDNDMGDQFGDGGDGLRFVLWMAEHEIWPERRPDVHSANPVAAARMRADIERYFPGPSRD
jgi:hypothetical protein